MIDCVYQIGRRKAAEHHAVYVTVTFDVYQVCYSVSKMGVVLHQGWSESQWTALLRYLTNILLYQQVLNAIKRVVDDTRLLSSSEIVYCTSVS